jgi:hypothetical protein
MLFWRRGEEKRRKKKNLRCCSVCEYLMMRLMRMR